MSEESPAARHRAARRAPIRGMLTVASTVAGLTFAGIATVGGSYALWQDNAPVSAGVIESGSLQLLINGQPSVNLTAAHLQKLLPGDRVTQQVTLSNTGTVAADVTAQTAMASSDYEVRVAGGACPSTALTTASTLTAPVALGLWAASEVTTVCIEVTLKPTASPASQGAQAPFTLTFTATQKVA